MSEPHRQVLRLATYNIHACVGSDGQRRPDRILAVLAELDADIIAVQEVDSRRLGPGDPDQFELLARDTGMHAVAGSNIRAHRGNYGNVLLSRWAPVRTARVDLSVAGREPRGAIDATFAIGRRVLRIVATHLGLRRRERRQQFRRLDDLVEADAGTSDVVALAGDFNVWGISLPYRRQGWRWHRRSSVRSFPARWPLLSLDRIAVSPPAQVLEIAAHRSPLARVASDHLPVVATLEWSA